MFDGAYELCKGLEHTNKRSRNLTTHANTHPTNNIDTHDNCLVLLGRFCAKNGYDTMIRATRCAKSECMALKGL